MDEASKDAKLKELEKSLAAELDQEVKSPAGQPSTSAPQATDNSATPASDVVSLEDLDKIIDQHDPTFRAQQTEVHGAPGDSSDTSSLQGSTVTTQATEAQPPSRLKSMVMKVAMFPIRVIEGGYDKFEEFRTGGLKKFAVTLKEKLPLYIQKLRELVFKTKDFFWRFFERARKLKWQARLQLAGLVAIVLVTIWFFKGVLSDSLPIHFEQPHFLGSFEEVADRIVEFEPTDPIENFDNPLRHPEYVILIKRMIVNIKQGGESGPRPMMAMELFLEANSQKAATELKDREREIRDTIARVAEEMSFDEISQEFGREKLKTLIRRDVNQLLNNGRVKRVYFKTFFYKP